MNFDNYLRDIEEEMNRHKRQMDSYLNDLMPRRSEPETRFCPYCGHDIEVSMTFCPYCGADLKDLEDVAPNMEDSQTQTSPIVSSIEQIKPDFSSSDLTHYTDLENESQAKIGTFEILRGQYSSQTYGYDFDTKDYAPLVSLLSGVVEIETNLSLYQLLRALNGVDMRSRFDKDCRGAKCIGNGRISIELSEGRQTLGGLCCCVQHFAKIMQPFFEYTDKLNSILPKINVVRRDASHGVVIDKKRFKDFYNNAFHTFYDTLLPHLLQLKKDLRNGDLAVGNKGVNDRHNENYEIKNSSGLTFANYAGYADRDYLDSIQGIFDDCGNDNNNVNTEDTNQHPKASRTHNGTLYESGAALKKWGEIRRGVILTNIEKLSLKYHQGINVYGEEGLMTFVNSIKEPIQQYIELSKLAGNEYVLLDMSSPEYAHFIKKDFSWQKHLEALEAFVQSNNISNANPWGLFIIGGDDVIPMPKVENPTNIFKRHDKVDALEADVDTDVPYAFAQDEIEVGEAGELKYDTLLHRTAGPRFIVGRLPMETGLMETDFSHPKGFGDFDIYTLKMLRRFLHVDTSNMQQERAAGIDVRNALCTVAERFFNHARKSVRNLPMLCNGNEGGLAKEGYFVSPTLDILSEDASVNEAYKERIQQTDMLVYVTHGCASNSDMGSGYVGDSINGDSHPTVLNPELIHTTSASVLAPVCCWGARFINYRRDRSMLLTAIFESNILTFLGASRSAPAAPDNTIGGAEGLQNFFAHYVMQGIPVAEAMLRAKYDMLHTMTDPAVQSLPNLLCFVEFNLFGDPLLRAEATEQRQSVAETIRTPEMKTSDIGLIDKDLQTIAEEYNCYDGYSAIDTVQNTSLLEHVRNMVNNNLVDIRKVVDKHLYEVYGVEPRTLTTIHRLSTSDGNQLHIFRYSDTDNIVHSHTMAFINNNGTIRSVIQTI